MRGTRRTVYRVIWVGFRILSFRGKNSSLNAGYSVSGAKHAVWMPDTQFPEQKQLFGCRILGFRPL